MCNGLLLVDCDGTFLPGTEVRNRKALQGIVDHFTQSNNLPSHQINWDLCNGQPESNIHKIITDNGFPELGKFVTADEFTTLAKKGYKETEVDLTPREGMIEILLEYTNLGIFSIMVTNSETESVEDALKAAFSKAGNNANDVFPIIITKTNVLLAGNQPKPSRDPFDMAYNLAQLEWGAIPLDRIAILEDSGTGVIAAHAFTSNPSQVIQFIDMASPHASAGYHVQDMVGCRIALDRIFSPVHA